MSQLKPRLAAQDLTLRNTTSETFDMSAFPTEIRNALTLGHAEQSNLGQSEISHLERQTLKMNDQRSNEYTPSKQSISFSDAAYEEAKSMNNNRQSRRKPKPPSNTVVYRTGLPPNARNDPLKYIYHLYIQPQCSHCPSIVELIKSHDSLNSCTYVFDASTMRRRPKWLTSTPMLHKTDTNELILGGDIMQYISSIKELDNRNEPRNPRDIDDKTEYYFENVKDDDSADEYISYNKDQFEEGEYIDDQETINSMNYSYISAKMPQLKSKELPQRDNMEHTYRR